jgi:hypothetical protein
MSGLEFRRASIHVVPGQSLVVPLIIDGLPESISALSRRWERKREFHLTVLAERRLAEVAGDRDDMWDRVIRAASGRALGPVLRTDQVRLVTHSERPELRTIVVMVRCDGIEDLVEEISQAIGKPIPVPPAHVTVYSSDPAQGIGITDQGELAERAPPLTEAQQAEVRRALGW